MRYVVTDQQYLGHARGEVIEAMPADPRVQAALKQCRLAPAPAEPVTTEPAKPAPKRRGRNVP